jgi:hypothetical protein
MRGGERKHSTAVMLHWGRGCSTATGVIVDIVQNGIQGVEKGPFVSKKKIYTFTLPFICAHPHPGPGSEGLPSGSGSGACPFGHPPPLVCPCRPPSTAALQWRGLPSAPDPGVPLFLPRQRADQRNKRIATILRRKAADLHAHIAHTGAGRDHVGWITIRTD